MAKRAARPLSYSVGTHADGDGLHEWATEHETARALGTTRGAVNMGERRAVRKLWRNGLYDRWRNPGKRIPRPGELP